MVVVFALVALAVVSVLVTSNWYCGGACSVTRPGAPVLCAVSARW